MTDEIDLKFLARQNERIMSDMGSLRDDMRVLTAMVLRLENTLGRMNDRIREDIAP